MGSLRLAPLSWSILSAKTIGVVGPRTKHPSTNGAGSKKSSAGIKIADSIATYNDDLACASDVGNMSRDD